VRNRWLGHAVELLHYDGVKLAPNDGPVIHGTRSELIKKVLGMVLGLEPVWRIVIRYACSLKGTRRAVFTIVPQTGTPMHLHTP
jgi:hypothetical protein